MLQLQVLGSPSVNRDGRPCGGAAGQRKSLALLALLAAGGRRGLSRDKIHAWLWPEISTDKATHRLAQLLYSLRRDLGTEELFLGSTDLRLNPTVLTTDLAEFTTALEVGDFARAVGAYGGPFLDGFYLNDAPEFEHSVEEERSRLAQRHAAALEALARDAAARGDVVAAAGWWRQLAQAEPLNARVAVCYMEALCTAGDRPSALRFAQAYETLLRQEFDTGPDPAVVAAAERLRQLPAGAPAVGAPAAPAIAVLPFVNLTPGGENEYFSDGLTDELTNALARVTGLRVASRTSTYALQGKGLDARELADRLGVGALVEGSVRKVGNRFRLSARLVNAADGCQLWSETYERMLEDVFALVEELSRAIAGLLPLAAGPVRAPLVLRSTAVLDAYTLYLRGRYAAHKRTPEGLSLGIEYFEQAVELDPGYALGVCGSRRVLGHTGLRRIRSRPATRGGASCPLGRARGSPPRSGARPSAYLARCRPLPLRLGLGRGRDGVPAGDPARSRLRFLRDMVRDPPRSPGATRGESAPYPARRGDRAASPSRFASASAGATISRTATSRRTGRSRPS